MSSSIVLSLYLILAAYNTFSLEVDPNDLLAGAGLFPSQSIMPFSLDTSHSASFIAQNNTHILRLQKPAGEQIQFQRGLTYSFQNSQPKHISFKFASTNPDTEDSNLRVCNQNGDTIVLFRAGKGGLIRVNQQQMISFYNQSVSTDTNIQLTQIDLKLDWTQKTIDIFVGNSYKERCGFFNSNLTQVNKVLVYNLYNSVSYWQDIVICQQICYSFSYENYCRLIGIITMLFILLIIS